LTHLYSEDDGTVSGRRITAAIVQFTAGNRLEGLQTGYRDTRVSTWNQSKCQPNSELSQSTDK